MPGMLVQLCKHGLRSYKKWGLHHVQASRQLTTDVFKVSEEVKAALHHRKPVVALETTIVTHGMPYPHNIVMAREVEGLIRQHGAVPATIGIVRGKIQIGMTAAQLEYLAEPETQSVKTSRRDLSYVLSQGLNGGTTVSGTMILAHMSGIPVFVTGGIGGVHRGAQDSMDISADLTELGRTPVAVVSSGVKSILDIERTLEYLETEGVCVATFGPNKDFPAFFSRRSGYQATYNVTSALDAAQLIFRNQQLELQTGTLVAVPIPAQFDTLGEEIETVIQSVLKETQDNVIQGREVTPYILKRVNELTGGQSLEANIHLVKNNAVVGSQIAVELSKIQGTNPCSETSGQHKPGSGQQLTGSQNNDEGIKQGASVSVQGTSSTKPRYPSLDKKVVVVGGTIVDFYARMTSPEFQPNGATYAGTVKQSVGGVGRNLADGLSRLNVNTLFISAVGHDAHMLALEASCKHMNLSRVARLEGHNTATYCAVLGSDGELMFGIGDMDVHAAITPKYVSYFKQDLMTAELVCIDGNISMETIDYVCRLCKTYNVPVLYEPTDHLSKAFKPFETDAYKAIVYTSPNFNELKSMASYLRGEEHSVSGSADDLDCDTALHQCVGNLQTVSQYIPVVLVTLGKHGVILCRHGDRTDTLPMKGDVIQRQGEVILEHFPAQPAGSAPVEIVSVSGAGDCLMAGIVAGILDRYEPSRCVQAGLLAARLSLQSSQTVPETLSRDALSDTNIAERMNISAKLIR